MTIVLIRFFGNDKPYKEKLMDTNRDRLKYLLMKVAELDVEIERNQLQDQYMELDRDLREGKRQPKLIDDNMWEVLLPKERERDLLDYYHCLRVELLTLREEVMKRDESGMLEKSRWVERPWIKLPLTVGGLVDLTVQLYHLGHTAGLWLKEDDKAKRGTAHHSDLG